MLHQFRLFIVDPKKDVKSAFEMKHTVFKTIFYVIASFLIHILMFFKYLRKIQIFGSYYVPYHLDRIRIRYRVVGWIQNPDLYL